MLTNDQGKTLLNIARKNIISYLDNGGMLNFSSDENIDLINKNIWLNEKGAVFVTLNLSGNLKGCIGSLVAYRSLIEDVLEHSCNAAFKDTRFSPVTKNDMKNIEIEISVLSEKKDLKYTDFKDLKSKIEPFTDGVYLTYGPYSSTFLPQVWDQLPDFDQFMNHLCNKAGLSLDIFSDTNKLPTIEIYNVQKFEEQ